MSGSLSEARKTGHHGTHAALQEFHIDSIKVDRELTRGAGEDGDADRILRGIVGMAHAMDVRVVAEGVERDEQLQFLDRLGCDYAQGFLFSVPLSRNDFEALLVQSGRWKPP